MALNRRDFLKHTAAAATLAGLPRALTAAGRGPADRAGKPNVLFVIFDDLNDYVSTHGGHPLAITPNFARLAKRGTTFTNAHVQATVCTPSRCSILSGRLPTTLDCYELGCKSPQLAQVTTKDWMPGWFAEHGYSVPAAGKVFHGGTNLPKLDGWPNAQAPGDTKKIRKGKLKTWTRANYDWGPTDEDASVAYIEKLTASIRQLKRPFCGFFGCGIPHVPLYAPRRFFDLYPLDEIPVPDAFDASRLPAEAQEILSKGGRGTGWDDLVKAGKGKNFIQAYLACVSYADAVLGALLDGLDQTRRDDTYVVVVSDHGFHLGEKGTLAKRTLYHESTRIPMIVSGPGVARGAVCAEPVGAIDLFPTLAELCGLPAREGWEGSSLAPQLADAKKARGRPVVTSLNPTTHAARDARWTYIQHGDQARELYDRAADPDELINLGSDSKHRGVIAELAKSVPRAQPGTAPGTAPKRRRRP